MTTRNPGSPMCFHDFSDIFFGKIIKTFLAGQIHGPLIKFYPLFLLTALFEEFDKI